jgi:fructoselysine and glucoselysine-specific PTS system IID component
MGIIVFLALLLGAPAMKIFLDKIPQWVNEGLQLAGNMLPALGFALLLNVMYQKKVAPYFFLGFILSSYLKLPMIAIGGLGVVLALILANRSKERSPEEEDISDSAAPVKAMLSKRDLRRVFFRSMALEANYNFETCQNTGFAFSMVPVLKKMYKTRDDMARALKRHLQFFNTSPYGSTLIMGITAAMEEKNAGTGEFNPDAINTVKSGLMGPLAGVFDSLFWGTLKVVAAGIGTSLALQGSIAGPLLFILVFNIPHLWLRYNLTFTGYNQGNKFLQRLSGSALMDNLTAGASIVGLMVVGAMPSMLMNIHTPLHIGLSGSGITLQEIIDKLVPGAIPLAFTFLTFWLVRKNVKTTWLLLGLIAAGFIANLLHILN